MKGRDALYPFDWDYVRRAGSSHETLILPPGGAAVGQALPLQFRGCRGEGREALQGRLWQGEGEGDVARHVRSAVFD